MSSRHLTKSRYMAGLQCLRRLWLVVNEPGDYEPPPPGSALDMGIEIGRKAHLLFPGGVLVDEEAWQHNDAVAHTIALMNDPDVPAIFEGAVEYDGVRVRADVLYRITDGSWGLGEVKSSLSVKDRYIDDLAIQAWVVINSGILLSRVELIHVNGSYLRGRDGIEWKDFFTRVDLMTEVTECHPHIPDRLPPMRECLTLLGSPAIEPGPQCSEPIECEYWESCTIHKPKDWIRYLPRLGRDRYDELLQLGIEAISAIPSDFPLSNRQALIRDVLVTNKPFVSTELGDYLQGSGLPAYYLDFEAMLPAIPLYEATGPYQPIPFQWSLHHVSDDGTIMHLQFLGDNQADPRRTFIQSLITALTTDDIPIVVYSHYEKTRLNDLAELFPDIAADIYKIIERLVDLLPVVRACIYFPEFNFSNSIKNVAPALCPSLSYDNLDGVSDGMAAANAFAQLASGRVETTGDAQRLRAELLAYCKHDTLAMVEVHRELMKLAVGVRAKDNVQICLA